VGTWIHSDEMVAHRLLPLALAELGLVPPSLKRRPRELITIPERLGTRATCLASRRTEHHD
jgi:hypothetical protein